MRDEDIKIFLDMKDDISELKRRLASVVQIGEILSSEDNRLYKVDVQGMEVSDCVKAESFFGGEASGKAPLSKGDLVLLLSQGGDLTRAVIGGSIPRGPSGDKSDDFSISFKDGLSITYKRSSKALLVKVPAGGSVTIESESGISLKGNVEIDGTLKVTKEVSAKDFETEMKIKLGKHKHGVDVSKAITNSTLPEV